MNDDQNKHWVYRKSSKPKMWIFLLVLLLLSLIPELFIHHHNPFSSPTSSTATALPVSWGFNAWYGFGTCLLMVIVAKFLGIFLKRSDRYYDD